MRLRPVPAALGLLAAAALLLVTAPAAVITDVPFDVFIPLEGGWRAALGQVPHRDFHTPVGVLWYALYGGLIRACGDTERVLLFAPVLGALAATWATLFATAGRLDDGSRAVLAATAGLTAMSPRALDGTDLAFLASYNRIGWALAIPGLLLVLLPPPPRRNEAGDGAVLLALLLALAFLKITYFGVVGLGIGLALGVAPTNRRPAVAAGVAAWAVLGLLWLTTDLLPAYAHDLLRALRSAAPGSQRTGPVKLGADLVANLPAVLLTVALLAAAASRDRAWRPPLAALGVLALGLAVAQQSHDHQVPLLVVAVALAARHAAAAFPEQPRLAPLALAVAVLVPGFQDVVAIGRNAALSRDPTATVAAWPGARVRFLGSSADLHLDALAEGRVAPDAYFAADPPVSGPDLALLLGAGKAELDARYPEPVRIFTVASSHAFTWIRRAPPPRGTDAWYDYGRTFGPRRPIDAEATLAEVDVVMDPIGLRTPTIDRVRHDLLPVLRRDFTPTETPLWRIWSRR